VRSRTEEEDVTVKELIDQLRQFEPTDEVHISYSHWGTVVAPRVRYIVMLPVIESEPMPRVIHDDDARYHAAKQVVVLG